MFLDPGSLYISIGSDKGLALNRRQAVIWSNDEPGHWRIYDLPGLNELNAEFFKWLHLWSLKVETQHRLLSFTSNNKKYSI